MPNSPMTPMSATTRALLAGILAGGLAAACTSADPPMREPPPEVSAAPAPPPAAAPTPSGPENASAAELETARWAEESLERVSVAEPSPTDQDDSVLEVPFETGTATLSADARARLDGMYESLLVRASDFYLDVQGHTDRTGSEAANQRLAGLRAEAVRRYLHQAKGVPMERMGLTRLGSAVPVASNQTSDGREQNRRVVVVVLLPP